MPIGRAWLVTAAIHVLAVILFFTVNLAAPWRKAEYVVRLGDEHVESADRLAAGGGRLPQ